MKKRGAQKAFLFLLWYNYRMRKTLSVAIYTLIFLIFFYTFFTKNTHAQEVKIEGKNIDYTLAYPGILPDHPLYFLKSMRDDIVYFLTRDYLKKAKLNLAFSDKKARMAIELSRKGKSHLALVIIIDGEKDFLKIPKLLTTSKNQGGGSGGNFIATLRSANEKHREVIESLLKEAPQGELDKFNEALKLNKTIQTQLGKI